MPQIFLSYARGDVVEARRFYNDLADLPGIHVWMDERDLLPGMKWGPAIFKAIRESRCFIALLSTKSTSGPGFRHTEIRKALEIVDQFPDDYIFVIPTRLDNCVPPIESLTEYSYADLFPNWSDGVARLRQTLTTVTGNATEKHASASTKKSATAASLEGRHYRVALVDMAARLKELSGVARSLNRVQSLFAFHALKVKPSRAAETRREGFPQLDLDRLSDAFYDQIAPLTDDRIICNTGRLLLFEEGNTERYNYLGWDSPVNRRVTFTSVFGLRDHAAKAGVSVSVAIAYYIVSDLAAFFLETDYHRATRSCPLDFTEDHDNVVKGLRKGQFCKYCQGKLTKHKTLNDAVTAMLRWGRDK